MFWIPEAMVATVARAALFPCRRIKDTVSVVPVEGDQVMLNGVPAVIAVGSVTKLNGFCADASEARAAKRREVEYCIFALFL